MAAFKKPVGAGSFADVMNKALQSEEKDDNDTTQKAEPQIEVKEEVVEKPRPKINLEETKKTVTEKEEKTKPKERHSISIPMSVISEDNIARVIIVYEHYNQLDKATRRTTIQYLGLDDDVSIEKIIHKILQVTNDDVEGLSNFVELKRSTPTDRAFALMAMENNELLKLNEIVSSFNDNYEYQKTIGDDRERIDFCRNLDRGLTEIPDNSLDVLAPMMDLLKRGREVR